MNTLLSKHEWRYIRNVTDNQTLSVTWRNGYMISPERKRISISDEDTNETVFAIAPSKEQECDRTIKTYNPNREVYFVWEYEELVKESFMKKLRVAMGV